MSKRVAVILTDEAHEIMYQNSSERGRGEWISDVITSWAAARTLDGAGVMEQIAARLARLEDLARLAQGGNHDN